MLCVYHCANVKKNKKIIIVLVQLAMAKDPEAAFLERLKGLQPCEVSQLKAGNHIFAVYGPKDFNVSGLFTYFIWRSIT